MATSITSRNFSLQPPFRFYEGQPKSQRGRGPARTGKRKIDTPPGSPFIDIDEIVPPDPETNEGTRLTENVIVIESDSDSDSDSETDSIDEPPPNQPRSSPPSSSPPPSHQQPYDEHSSDELPDIQDLLCSHSSQEAYIVTAPIAQRSEGDSTCGKNDHDNDNDEEYNHSELEAQCSDKRKRVRFSSVDTTIPALEAPYPEVGSDLNDESPAKRQRLDQHTKSASTSMNNTLPAILVPPLAPTAIGDESNNASHDGQGVVLDGRRGSGGDGEDTPINFAEPAVLAEPSTQPPSTLQWSLSDRQERDGPREPDKLQNNIDNGRTIKDGRGPPKPLRIAVPASSLPERSAAKIVTQQTHQSDAQSLSFETAPSPLSRPTPFRTSKGAAHLGSNDDGMSVQHASLQVDEIILRPASAGALFLVATIRTTDDTLQLACLEPAELLESTLGHMGKVDSITVKPSTPGSWHVIGVLRPLHPREAYIDNSRSTVGRGAIRAPSTLRDRARALYTADTINASTDDAIHCNRYNGIGSEGSEGNEGGDDHYDDENYELPVRASRRWDPLEEKRLQAWRKENRPWDWIFDQFPDRTEAAVRVRWYMLQRSTRNVH